ncbi:MAG: carboxyl transferase [Lachnospiraceae bacterium]|nr:carboxyl transferase [Lachnospiraceae bacterium]
MSSIAQTSAGRRIESLLDDGSFVEIGGCVTARSTDFNMSAKKLPADGVITGYGTIDGNLVYVYSQDASVLGGTMGEMHAKKISNIYSLAMKMGAPVVGMIDCAGLRLQEATDALAAFGGLYLDQVNASGVIPQITAVYGTCGGGMALVPALTDFTFMEAKSGKLFVNAPNTLDGNYTSKCDTASVAFQSEEVGSVDFAGTEEEIADKIRELIALIPANNDDTGVYSECSDDLNRLTDGIDAGAADAAYVLSQIADGEAFFEVKADYAKEMVTGFMRLNGLTIGAVANRSAVFDENGEVSEKLGTVLTAKGCKKAADFVKFCDAFDIPVLSLTQATGFKADKCNEKRVAAAAASLAKAFADATVAKVNVIIGDAYGTPYVVMNSKAIGADMTFAWPEVSVGMMDATSAVKIIYADEISKDASIISEKSAEYSALQNSASSAAARGYVDAIIEPAQTRKNLIAAFEMLYTKREDKPVKKHSAN